MKRCPNCHRFGVKYNPSYLHEKCSYCNWINIDDIDVDKVKHPIKFWKFIKTISRKIR